MATLPQPFCCCRPSDAAARPSQKSSSVMVAGAVAAVLCASAGLEISDWGAKFRSTCGDERRNWATGGWDEWRGRSEGRGLVLRARRGGPGGSSRALQPTTTSRAPPTQNELRSNRQNSKKTTTTSKDKKKLRDDREDNEFDEDALEALFAQLEMDLEAGGLSDDEDLTEEEVMELENELAAALQDFEDAEDEEELQTIDVVATDAKTSPDTADVGGESESLKRGKNGPKTGIKMQDEFADMILQEYGDDEDEEEEQRVVNLEPWQLKKLAAAVEIGRRKVNIKALSAEVGLDRFDVLAWLKNPPPELVMYSATMQDDESAEELPPEDAESSRSLGKQEVETLPQGGTNWHSQKRLKKEHEATFERVFRNTDRPSLTDHHEDAEVMKS